MSEPTPENREAMFASYKSWRVSLFGNGEKLKNWENFGEGSEYYNWAKRGEELVQLGIISAARFQLDQAKILLKCPHPEAEAAAVQNLAGIEMDLQYGGDIPEDAIEEYGDAISDPGLERKVLEAARRMIEES